MLQKQTKTIPALFGMNYNQCQIIGARIIKETFIPTTRIKMRHLISSQTANATET